MEPTCETRLAVVSQDEKEKKKQQESSRQEQTMNHKTRTTWACTSRDATLFLEEGSRKAKAKVIGLTKPLAHGYAPTSSNTYANLTFGKKDQTLRAWPT